MEIKADRIEELEKFGFAPFFDRIAHGYQDRGTENGYRKVLDDGNALEVVSERKNWKWIGSEDLFVLYPVGVDYDAYPCATMFDEVAALIKAGMVEGV